VVDVGHASETPAVAQFIGSADESATSSTFQLPDAATASADISLI
jgi:hypothetical protein